MEHAIPSWSHRAACRGDADPELWFPISKHDPAADARATCEGCPVRRECGEDAYDAGHQIGIWAGFRLDDAKSERAELRAWLDQVEPVETSPCVDCGTEIRHIGKLRQTLCPTCRLDLIDDGPVREHVLALGLDYVALGQLSGVHRKTISKIARGETGGTVKAAVAARLMAIRTGAQ